MNCQHPESKNTYTKCRTPVDKERPRRPRNEPKQTAMQQ